MCVGGCYPNIFGIFGGQILHFVPIWGKRLLIKIVAIKRSSVRLMQYSSGG